MFSATRGWEPLRVPRELQASLEACSARADPAPGVAACRDVRARIEREFAELSAFGGDVRAHIARRGFAVLRGLPCANGADGAARLFATLTCALGEATSHSLRSDDVVWHVQPEAGADALSKSRAEIPLHTDSAFKEQPEKYLGLFAIENESGGETRLLDFRCVEQALQRSRSGQRCLDLLATALVPLIAPRVFGYPSDRLAFAVLAQRPRVRYRKDLVEAALGAGSLIPLDVAQALAELDDAIATRAVTSYNLQAGEALFIDNHLFLHGRGALGDGRRHLLRIRFN